MAGVLGNFMRHSRARSEIQRRREVLKAEREARSKSGSVDAVPKSQAGKGGTAQKIGTPSKNNNNKQVTKPSAQKTQVKQAPSKQVQQTKGTGGKKGKKGHKHQQYDLIVTIDLVEYGLTDDLVAEFKEAFMLFDKDEDGMITTAELGVVMRSLGQRPSETELRKLVGEVETCADGTIEFNEFLQMMSKKLKDIGNGDELKEAFKVFDKKNSGYLSSTELRHVMTSMGEKMSEQEVEDMIKEAAPNGDGRVNYEEFANIIARKH
ncbi:calmodulin-A-like isoform X1 [Penaeus chinensis]|uniref:calmodulin-A-like isoform X1 n=1 Tax=Penaeus chinensis TaxID=139456 RepID=UPI001FB62656|nr:calmodulin-A-like isoform X1 [Penaeus chinensis]